MSSSNVEKIKERLDIVTVIGAYVPLTKAGASYKGKSPFTQEKTPSFFVSPDRGLYYCFSTGKGGDIFTFIQEVEGVDFQGALTMLADQAGIVLEKGDKEKQSERQKLFEIVEAATVFFEENLSRSTVAKEYLKQRGISDKTISEWRIGVAPDEWRGLYVYLTKKGYAEPLLLKAGLIKKSNEKGDRTYDTFRNRIMFPIQDTSGRVIAFSGRVLSVEDSPKYVNSPDTPLYEKSHVLYGLDKAKTFIRRRDFAILVEGQMDLVMSHQAGIVNTVASSGTSITTFQLEILGKITKKLLIALDADSAGVKAALRLINLAFPLDFEVKIAKLPEGSDPADIAKEDPKKLKSILAHGMHAVEFFTQHALKAGSRRAALREIKEKVLPLITLLQSSIDVDLAIQHVAEAVDVSAEAIRKDLKLVSKNDFPKNNSQSIDSENNKVTNKEGQFHITNSPERTLVSIIYWKEKDTSFGDHIKTRLKELLGEEVFEKIYKELLIHKDALVFEVERLYGGVLPKEQDIEELLYICEERVIQKDISILKHQIHVAEKKESGSVETTLLTKLQNLLTRKRDVTEKKNSLRENE